MFLELLIFVLGNIFFFSLHIINNGSFPKALPLEKEKELFTKFHDEDDIESKNLLIEHNLRLVAHIVKKYYSLDCEQDDLISIGTIGLIKAVSTFDYSKGTRFATYGARCIENEILMYFRGAKKLSQEVYISDPIDTDKEGNSLTLMDIVSDDVDIVDNIDLMLKTEKLYKLINAKLPKREQEILFLRYGLGGLRPLPQREVADKLKISRSYVSRLENKAIESLREFFEKD